MDINKRYPKINRQYAKLVSEALSIMIKVDDEEILQDVCWTYSYLTESGTNQSETYFQVDAVCKSPALWR